ncbi:MAG TPA: FtsQ-type POTRA domain-containing protein, partial [Actinomycetota bacterium]|nr:FtsQ-type POTRA domain-containing protein [Actinomycetota bacterium]
MSSTLPRSRFRWTASILVGLAVIAAAGWWATNTPLFDLRTLTVSGNRHLSDAAVARLAGLSSSTNVMWLRTDALAERIERDPWVLRASVSRTLPATVTVSIEERSAVAIVESGRVLLFVSGDGVVLGRARAGASARLPAIALPGAPMAMGTRIARAPAVLVVARSLPAGIRAGVERIIQVAPDSLILILRNGARVLYGDDSEADAKGRALSSLLAWARERGIRADSIDLRSPAAPALLP